MTFAQFRAAYEGTMGKTPQVKKCDGSTDTAATLRNQKIYKATKNGKTVTREQEQGWEKEGGSKQK